MMCRATTWALIGTTTAWVAVPIVVLCAAGPLAAQEPQPASLPTFRAGVAMVALDVSVLDTSWTPVPGLATEDFEVEIAGRRRPVRTLDYVTVKSAGNDADSSASAAREIARPPRRTFVVLVDDLSYPFGRGAAMLSAVGRFVESLPSGDGVGVVSSSGRQVVEPTTDRAAATAALASIAGSYRSPSENVGSEAQVLQLAMSTAEALAIYGSDPALARDVALRECGGAPDCVQRITDVARDMAWQVHRDLAAQARSWTAVIDALARMPGYKVLVVISRGAALEAASTVFGEFSRRAAAAGVRVHILADAEAGGDAESARFARGGRRHDDERLFRAGLEELASSAGGTFQHVVGSPERSFANIVRANEASYRLGVEIPVDARAGVRLEARVRVRRRGVTVHVAREVLARDAGAAARVNTEPAPNLKVARSTDGERRALSSAFERPPVSSVVEPAAPPSPLERPALPSAEAVLATLRQDVASAVPLQLGPLLAPRTIHAHLTTMAAAGSAIVRSLAPADSDAEFWRRLQDARTDGATALGRFVSGVLALQRGQPDVAWQVLETALEAAPDSTAVLRYLGVALAACGRDRDAVGPWQLTLADPLATAPWQIEHANALARLGDLAEATRVLEETARASLADVSITRRLGELLFAQGRFDEGRRVLDTVLVQSPDDERALFLVTAHAFAAAIASPGDRDAVSTLRTVANRYVGSNGSRAAMVQEWVRLLEP